MARGVTWGGKRTPEVPEERGRKSTPAKEKCGKRLRKGSQQFTKPKHDSEMISNLEEKKKLPKLGVGREPIVSVAVKMEVF